jgi:hypothetical protein
MIRNNVSVRLESGNTVLTCRVDKLVKTGDQITLKDDTGRWWDVKEVYSAHDWFKHDWKVGGLR